MNIDYDKILKCIFIGDASVGKTSLCKKLCGTEFPLLYQSTIGVDFFVKIINVNNENIKLQIWDTTGQEKYKSITTSFYRNARFIFYMFDFTNFRSFNNLKNWVDQVNFYCDLNYKKVVIGNKSDLKSVISKLEIENFCNEYNIKFYSCSVKNDNIEELIYNILTENLEVSKFNNLIIDDNVIKLNNKKNKKCCNIL